jgi:LmbE family N-acetylglucosaminyl deacetylase
MSKLNLSSYDAVFFSPHLDDAVLSCGALLARLANKRKKTLVVTLFTRGQRLASPSKDEQLFRKQAGIRSAEALFVQRRQEDQRAAKILGFEALHLGFIDALWRTSGKQALYPTFAKIFQGKINGRDTQLLQTLTSECRAIIKKVKPTAPIYAPLAIGQHVDHVVTFTRVQKLSLGRRAIVYWEDVPYRNQIGAREKRFAQLDRLPKPSFLIANPNESALKHKACEAYTSQLPWLKEAGLGDIDFFKEGFFTL